MIDKNAMVLLVRATRDAKEAAEALHTFTGDDGWTKLDEIYGKLLDCLYLICGEKTDTLRESLVWKLIQNADLTDEFVAEAILAVANNEAVSC